MKVARSVPRIALVALVLVGGLGLLRDAAPAVAASAVVVPVRGTVDAATVGLIQHALRIAARTHAGAVVLDIDSSGGLMAPAEAARNALLRAPEPVVAYVDPHAYSVAALLALAANTIVMAPGASIGDAEPVPVSAAAVAATRAEFAATARARGHDPQAAAAMVDRTVALPQFKPDGSVVTLDANAAVAAKVAAASADSLGGALAVAHLAGATRRTVTYSWGERLARIATSPLASVVLLALGLLGLLIEMQTLHGIAGAIGIAALALFFGSHIVAGFSNGLVALLAVLGLIGILWELHVVPGHGIPGIVGGLVLIAAVLLAFGTPFFFVAVESLATAIVLTAIVFSLVVRAHPENAWMQRLALGAAQGADYVTSRDFHALLGRVGVAASFLRPAGIATIDGERVDVLTEGEFIAQGTPVRVTRVEGARVFVETVAPQALPLQPPS